MSEQPAHDPQARDAGLVTGVGDDNRRDRWGWTFTDPEVEAEYRHWRVQQVIPYIRMGSTAAAAIWLLGIGFIALGAPHLLPDFSLLFVLVALPLIVANYVVTLTPNPSRRVIPLATVVGACAGLSAVWICHHSLTLPGSGSAIMTFIAFFSFSLRRLPPFAAIVSVLPGILYVEYFLMVDFYASRIGLEALAFYSFLPIATLLTGAMVCVGLESRMRAGFRNVRIIARQRQELTEERARLCQFLAPEVADLVREQGPEAALQKKTVTLTAVYCDLRGFTHFTAVNGAECMTEVLSAYYETANAIAERFGAMVKDFVGDGILILVGAPRERADHAVAGVAMARELSHRVGELVRPRGTASAPLGVGVGVATGPCAVGVIGSKCRLEYTAVGSAVNLSARLCSEATDGEVLVAPSDTHTDDPVAQFGSRLIRAKGFAEPIRVTIELSNPREWVPEEQAHTLV